MGAGGTPSSPSSILCPTDFSELSRHAAEHAVAIASVFGASITAYHVMPQTLMHPELFPYLKEPILVPPEIAERARQRLDSFAGELTTGEVAVSTRLESGDPVKRILELAAELDVDLLALGTHGRRGFRKWVLGSVTDQLLRRAPCSVLTVGSPPRPVRHRERLPYERILSAVDFSEGSLLALDEAIAFWRKSRGELVLVHVLEPEHEEGLDAEAARARLSRALPDPVPEGCRSEIVVVEPGEPHREIRREAEERAVDLVVAGVSGRGALDDLLFGSTISQIVRTVGCAVLSVRAKRAS